MKFLDYLFHGKELRYIDSYFKMLNGYSPTFTSYNGGVYEMDLTRTAVNSFATHCSKLKPEIEGSALKSLEKTLQHKPNYFMDTTKFIKRLATYVAVEHTAFIIPIEDEYGRLCGWYPLRAQRCEVVEAAGQVYLRYLFANGEHGAIEFERVGIMTDYEYTDDLFGEDNRTLKPTMQLIHTQNEGIINAVKNSANIRFLAKVANMLKPEDIKKERQRFTEDNLSADNDSGMIIYDNKFSELKQVESKPYTPNALQMQNIQENVCTHFGTNMDILQNKFDENTWNAYYEGKIEPFAIQLSLVMTNMSFTERERACGNAIFFSANRLQYASNATKLSVSTQLFDRALLNRNGVNLYAESGLMPNNLQNAYNNKLGKTDAEYTAAVDNGSYGNFVKDSAGYGLAQWTYWSRKQALFNHAKQAGVSIADLNMQLGFLWEELQGYTAVMDALKKAGSVRAASDAVLTGYEKPADQSETVKKKRAEYGEGYYKKYAAGNGTKYYRVRKSWTDAASQLGAFTSLENAKSACKAGYTVYDDNGKAVYTAAGQQASAGVPFSVQVDILDLNIRTGAGTNYAKTGETTGKGVFTIVEVKAGQGASVGWGRLKSGAGWISLDYATRLA